MAKCHHHLDFAIAMTRRLHDKHAQCLVKKPSSH
jgi:hypothetical protein